MCVYYLLLQADAGDAAKDPIVPGGPTLSSHGAHIEKTGSGVLVLNLTF